jgi:hypothetical protein
MNDMNRVAIDEAEQVDEAALREKGYTQQQMDQMTPQQAVAHLQPEATAASDPKPETTASMPLVSRHSPLQESDVPRRLRDAKRWVAVREYGIAYSLVDEAKIDVAKETSSDRLLTFKDAVARANGAMLGFAFFRNDGYAAVALKVGAVEENNRAYAKFLYPGAYVESLPAREGLHVLGLARISKSLAISSEGVNIYDTGVFPFTGERLSDNADVISIQRNLDKHVDLMLASAQKKVNEAATAKKEHAALLELRPNAPKLQMPEQLVVRDLVDFKKMAIPPREALVVLDDGKFQTPILFKSSINQIFAWRGTGKTMVAMGLGGAMATGNKFLKWKATRKIKVLYIEGETPDAQMQERARLLIGKTEPGYFRILTLDSQPNGIPPLATAEGRAAVEVVLEDAEVLELDSVSTLGGFATNDEEAWLEFLPWLARLRSRGLCIIFLHHAGKQGLQRGHSRSEDMLDVSIKLTAIDDQEVDYLNLKLEYDKIRADRRGIRALNVSCKTEILNGESVATGDAHQAQDEELAVLSAYLTTHPKATSRTIAGAMPELGGRTRIAKLMNKAKTGLFVVGEKGIDVG